jgi:hypothetical protein
MSTILRSPLLVLVASFVTMWISAQVGGYFRRRQTDIDEKSQQDRDMVVAATLTLLGLIIGFSFSMAIARYDQRKNYEEAEANAIGTEWVRADLLPASDAATVRKLLREYLDERIVFYEASHAELPPINQRTADLQAKLWSAVSAPVKAEPTPVGALIASGMNDVLNSQGYTQAAWWNRIPPGAWILMAMIAICSNFLVGYGTHSTSNGFLRFLVLPIVLSIAFFMIADIDSPRRGVIRVVPQNLIALQQSLQGQ